VTLQAPRSLWLGDTVTLRVTVEPAVPGGGALGACVMFYHQPGGIAIHGTNQPYLLNDPLPRNYSHGCARMYNAQALWLFARCPLSTPVHNFR
jgi:lipoprotein-anchoring transpeptidase ErfK/SrfK